MTGAHVERIEPDPLLAADFLARATAFASDGSNSALQSESRQVLLHSAVVAACDAVLAVEGRRVEGSRGGHRLRFAETHRLLADDHSELFDLLDESRVIRNEVSYAAGFVAPPDVEETAIAVLELLALVNEHVTPQLPDWKTES